MITLILVFIAVIFLLFLVYYSYKIHAFTPISRVIAKTMDEAMECDGYWFGKYGREFTVAEKKSAKE